MPLGDVAGTMLSLLIGWPQVHWVLRYRVDEEEFVFDDAPIKAELGEALPLSDPEVIGFLRGALREGIADVTRRTHGDYGMIAEG
jgi:hypothetical protein